METNPCYLRPGLNKYKNKKQKQAITNTSQIGMKLRPMTLVLISVYRCCCHCFLPCWPGIIVGIDITSFSNLPDILVVWGSRIPMEFERRSYFVLPGIGVLMQRSHWTTGVQLYTSGVLQHSLESAQGQQVTSHRPLGTFRGLDCYRRFLWLGVSSSFSYQSLPRTLSPEGGTSSLFPFLQAKGHYCR